MNNMQKMVAVLSLCFLTACTSETSYGKCIGAFDAKDPALVYKMSKWNVFVGIVFSEMLFIPPIMVIANQTLCPVAKTTTN